MRRSIHMLLAALMAGLIAAVSSGAAAQRREGVMRQDRRGPTASYAAPAAGSRGWSGRDARPAAAARWGDYPAPGGRYSQPRYAPEPPPLERPYDAPNRRAWARGQVLPYDYRGAEMAEPGRYHLRRPPPGYGWIGDGRDAYLVQRSTGMVLDAVPRAYEPVPAYRRPPG